MIELFCKQPGNLELKFDTGLTPIHIDDSIVSLSAILLNDVYYYSLVKGKRTVDGYSLIEIETVILFKIKAWLDMKERKEAGESADTKNIKKHKNDVFRLNNFSVFLRSSYNFYEMAILGRQCILMDDIDEMPHIEQIKKHIKKIKDLTDRQIVLF